MNTFAKKTAVLAAFIGVLSVASPVLAQSYYGTSGYNPYYPQQSYSYGTPMIYQPVTMPSYVNYAPVSIPNYGQMNSYSSGLMQQQYQYPQQQYMYQPQYQYPQNQNSAPLSAFQYLRPTGQQNAYQQQYQPVYGYGSIAPSTAFKEQSQFYPYTTVQRNPNSYPSYSVSVPPYDSSYASFSNYYQQYPSRVGQYTGNTDFFGTPLCNWGGGYNGYACDSDPSQPVYDPYTGTWY